MVHDRETAKALGLRAGPHDDTVFYEIYSDDQGTSEETLEDLRLQCLQFVTSHTQKYIWQKDCFDLHLAPRHPQPWLNSADSRSAKCLWGETSFGDNIEDEWLIAWLLLQLTRQKETLSARVWDMDGEFILIEAAYTLPQWVKPEDISDRLWIRGGSVHLIPPQSKDHPTLPPAPSTDQALQILRSDIDTRAPSRLQAVVAARLSSYPQRITGGMHRAAAVVPNSLARVLQQEPSLVAPAVLAFHYREPQEVEVARRMTHFPAEDLVETVVLFSRCLYAQLVTQPYDAPDDFSIVLPSEPSFPAVQLGAKLTAGFELLLARASHNKNKGNARTAQGNPGALQDVENSPAWPPFMQGLADDGFFGEQRLGTAGHDQLLLAAAEKFRRTAPYVEHRAREREPAERISAVLKAGCLFDPSEVEGPAESDAWLAEGTEEIEKQLKQRQSERDEDGEGKAEGASPSADPFELAERFKDFIGGEADLDGVDIPGRVGARAGRMDEEGPVDLNEEEIWKQMEQILDFGRPDGAADDLPGSEGSSFYGNYSDDDDSHGGDATSMSTKHVRQGRASPQAEKWSGTRESRPLEARRTFDDRFSPGGTSSMSMRKYEGRWGSTPTRAPRQEHGDGPRISPRGREDENGWEASTATGSDDDADCFEAAYDEALKAQMREANIFHPADNPAADQDGEEAVDLDMNLVQNLMASYQAQEGLPGPVGNLFGMMGLQLPTEPGDHSKMQE